MSHELIVCYKFTAAGLKDEERKKGREAVLLSEIAKYQPGLKKKNRKICLAGEKKVVNL